MDLVCVLITYYVPLLRRVQTSILATRTAHGQSVLGALIEAVGYVGAQKRP